jgi:SAM-dependent methyltransferase
MTESVHGVPLPPEELVFMDQDADRGYRHGMRLASRIGALGANVEDGLLLDIGCGYGRLAYGLLGNDFRGTYVGLDILPDRIEFLESHFTTAAPSYQFHLLDIRNDAYLSKHPKLSTSSAMAGVAVADAASKSASVDFSPYLDSSPTTVVLLSVFTHMYDFDIINYLRAARRVMAPDSRLVFTAFLFNEAVLERIANGESRMQLTSVLSDHCRTSVSDKPLAAIAYRDDWLRAALTTEGFECDSMVPGRWSGGDAKEYQDWVVARTMRPD